MLVNLSFNADFAEEQLLNNPDQKLFDISGAAAHLSNSNGYKAFRKLPGASELELEAIDEYLSFIGELSNANLGEIPIRSFQLDDLHFYWLLPIAIKHDSFHWGQVVFLFFKVSSNWPEILDSGKENLIILIDHNQVGLHSFILNQLIKLGYDKNRIVFKTPAHTKQRISGLGRKTLGLIKAVLTTSRLGNSESIRKASNVFVIYGNEPSQDAFLNQYCQLSESLQQPTAIIGFDTINLLRRQKKRRFRTLLKLINISRKLYRMRKKISSIRNKEIVINGLSFPVEIVKEEFEALLCRPELFLQHWCFTEIFKGIHRNVKIFFQDEFYPQGRLLSSAIAASGNSGIESFGIQHGLILRTHTVYALRPAETEGRHAMPLPNNFVVWGDYFKKMMLSGNHDLPLMMPVAGNLPYILMSNTQVDDVLPVAELRILWCTTLAYNFKFEVNTVKEELLKLIEEKKVNLKITVRPHPAGHLKTEDIETALAFLPNDSYTIENKSSITEQMQTQDVIFAAVYSSVFLDGLVMGKHVVRFNSGIALADFQDLAIPNLIDITTTNEFRDFIQAFLAGNIPVSNPEQLNTLCYMNKDRWVKLLTNLS